jgi:hypothetical protein
MKTQRDKIDFLFKVGERIDHYWNMSFIITVVIIGWLFTLLANNHITLLITGKLLLSLMYLLVLFLSFTALIRYYRLYEAVFSITNSNSEDGLDRELGFIRPKYSKVVVCVIHIFFVMVVMFMLWGIDLLPILVL